MAAQFNQSGVFRFHKDAPHPKVHCLRHFTVCCICHKISSVHHKEMTGEQETTEESPEENESQRSTTRLQETLQTVVSNRERAQA